MPRLSPTRGLDEEPEAQPLLLPGTGRGGLRALRIQPRGVLRSADGGDGRASALPIRVSARPDNEDR